VIGARPGDARRGDVDLVHARLQAVVRLRDRRRVEGVGLGDVGPGVEVGVVDACDDFGARQRKQIVVALEVTLVAVQAASRRSAEVGLGEVLLLDHRSPRAIEDENASGEQAHEFGGMIGLHR
jgi:hypothetical protein